MLATGWTRPSGIAGGGDALRPDASGCSIISQKCAQAREIRLEGIEQRKGFRGVHKIKVAAEADRMAVEGACDVVHNFKSRFAVEVRIPSINTGGECVGQFQVRLRRNGWKIK